MKVRARLNAAPFGGIKMFSFDMKATIEELKILFEAWNIIENDYNDSEEKDTAQKVINDLIISHAQEIAEHYEIDT